MINNFYFIVFLLGAQLLSAQENDTEGIQKQFEGKNSEEIASIFNMTTNIPPLAELDPLQDPETESDLFFQEQVKRKYPRYSNPYLYTYNTTTGKYDFKQDLLEKESNALKRDTEKKARDGAKKDPKIKKQQQSFKEAGVKPPIFLPPIPIPYVGSAVYTVGSTLEDSFSSKKYTKMLKKNTISLIPYFLLQGNINGFAKIIEEEKESLENIDISMQLIAGVAKNQLIKLSKKYFEKKYPILNPVGLIQGSGGRNFAKNAIIRSRYNYKIRKESRLINNYLNVDNPMSEGQRIFLTLSAVKKAIKITLENDTY